VKNGAGTQVFTGANTYTGATTINAGVLQIGESGAGSIASPTTVTGGTLAGTGFVNNSVAVNSASIVSPGDNGGSDLGTLTVGSAVFAAGSSLVIQLDPSQPGDFTPTSNHVLATSGASDRLVVNGELSLGGTLDLRPLVGGHLSASPRQEFDILDFDLADILNDSDQDGILDTHFDTYLIPYLHTDGYATVGHQEMVDSNFYINTGDYGDLGYYTWDFNDLYTQGIIRVIPEPGTWAVFGLGLLTLGFFRRRKK